MAFLLRALFVAILSLSPTLCRVACAFEQPSQSHSCCPQEQKKPAKATNDCCSSAIGVQAKDVEFSDLTKVSFILGPSPREFSSALVTVTLAIPKPSVFASIASHDAFLFLPLGSNAPPIA